MGKIPCQVCCVGFSRDRDMVLAKIDGELIYLCESEIGEMLGGDISCGFSFPAWMPQEKIDKLANKFIEKLRERV